MTSSAAPSSPNEAMSDDEECVSNLEKTINKIGMGTSLLSNYWSSTDGHYRSISNVARPSNFPRYLGWMADNMWLEAVAIILPRVQDHYAVSDGSIGWLSSSIFCGMMIGAIGWGTCSDLLGRTIAFNATLLLTGFFGVCASYFGTGIVSLCIALFFLGTAIGGSMPTDGTLFLENIPRRNRYLLTCLSVFFSFGAVLSAVVGLFVIPSSSCPAPPSPCDVETQNLGWKRLLYTLSGITIAMSLGRFILFRLYESPRFLVNTGRHEEAVHALQKITAFNGQPLKLNVKDVDDTYAPMTDPVVFDEGAGENQHLNPSSPLPYQDRPLDSPERFSSAPIVYSATGDDALPLEGDYSFHTPIEERACMKFPSPQTSPTIRLGSLDALSPRSRAVEIGSSRSPRSSMHVRRKSSMSLPPVVEGFILDRITDPLSAWWEKVSTLLSDEWRRSTLLIWAMWSLMSLAYTMFNVFLPKLLEKRMGHAGGEGKEKALWEVVIFTLGGCPGALIHN
ncbi:hypothetical protein FRB99_006774 [Tulasnella sp. 403]|nr:hypothetical protein FRB99_006774 [Tulasnella sp. 403]